MRKPWLKILFLELCFFLLASSYMPFSMFGDAYIMKHTVNKPCGFSSLPNGACRYDSPLAQWFEYVLHERNDSAFFDALDWGKAQALHAAAWLGGNSRAGYALTDVFIIGFWMSVLNLAYFGGRKIFRFAFKQQVSSQKQIASP